jgi:hypothetical protein
MVRFRIAIAGTFLALSVLAAAIVGTSGHALAAATLVKGWNNITYSGGTAPPSEALSSISGTYAAVYRWNPATQQYQVYAPGAPGIVNTLTQISSGDTIWLDVTAASASLTPGSSAVGGRVSIAASTFQPASDLALYEKTWNEIHPVGTDAASERYFAPVNLPDGATITSMTAHYEAGSGATVEIRLDYTPLGNGASAGQVYKLAEVLSTAGASPQTAQAFASVVDNSANVYFLIVDLKGGPGAKLRGVSVAYTGG